MSNRKYNILFLCTGNSARSILAEGIVNHYFSDKFTAYSAGSHPTGIVNPNAISLLHNLHIDTDFANSKDWNEFADYDAPKMDFVITVCDNAAGEVCPIWPGQPISAHWGIEDPAAVTGTKIEIAAAFNRAFGILKNRISAFSCLPIKSLDKLSLHTKIKEIGTITKEEI